MRVSPRHVPMKANGYQKFHFLISAAKGKG
jgi:hypothetical protein